MDGLALTSQNVRHNASSVSRARRQQPQRTGMRRVDMQFIILQGISP